MFGFCILTVSLQDADVRFGWHECVYVCVCVVRVCVVCVYVCVCVCVCVYVHVRARVRLAVDGCIYIFFFTGLNV